MLTERTSMDGPGTLAPIRRVMPSSGWIRSTSAFGSRPSWAASPKGRCGDLLAVDPAGPVLATDHVAVDHLALQAAQGLEHLGLLVADVLGLEAGRRLHGDQGQHLELVVLEDVADGPGGLVEVAPVLDAQRLRH